LEAANCPAREAGGRTVGCNITLPHEQKPAYTSIDRSRAATSRAKGLLFKYSFAFISLPGSVRTIDELFEALSSSSP
jgi:predicted Rossmann-fold nucleotide-binding protein